MSLTGHTGEGVDFFGMEVHRNVNGVFIFFLQMVSWLGTGEAREYSKTRYSRREAWGSRASENGTVDDIWENLPLDRRGLAI